MTVTIESFDLSEHVLFIHCARWSDDHQHRQVLIDKTHSISSVFYFVIYRHFSALNYKKVAIVTIIVGPDFKSCMVDQNNLFGYCSAKMKLQNLLFVIER